MKELLSKRKNETTFGIVLKLVNERENPVDGDPSSTPPEFSSDSGKAMRAVPISEEAAAIVEYKCQICGQVLMNESDLNAHVKSHLMVERRVEEKGATGIR